MGFWGFGVLVFWAYFLQPIPGCNQSPVATNPRLQPILGCNQSLVCKHWWLGIYGGMGSINLIPKKGFFLAQKDTISAYSEALVRHNLNHICYKTTPITQQHAYLPKIKVFFRGVRGSGSPPGSGPKGWQPERSEA